MNLYDRDYKILTPNEEAELRSLKEQEVVKQEGEIKRNPPFRKYPKAARHYISLFPNNYLDIVDLQDSVRLEDELNRFKQLLNSENVNERSILKFIKEHRTYFIVASLLKKYFHFGHHATYLFPEFEIGNSYQADYLIIGKSSGGWEFVFVELEAPKGNIMLADGNFGEAFRKGENQSDDWQTWLEARYSSLKETFDKSRRPDTVLPDEFLMMDKSRLHFVVVAGRRCDFKPKTYQNRRKKRAEKNLLLLHYDNLIDAAANVIGKATY